RQSAAAFGAKGQKRHWHRRSRDHLELAWHVILAVVCYSFACPRCCAHCLETVICACYQTPARREEHIMRAKKPAKPARRRSALAAKLAHLVGQRRFNRLRDLPLLHRFAPGKAIQTPD